MSTMVISMSTMMVISMAMGISMATMMISTPTMMISVSTMMTATVSMTVSVTMSMVIMGVFMMDFLKIQSMLNNYWIEKSLKFFLFLFEIFFFFSFLKFA